MFGLGGNERKARKDAEQKLLAMQIERCNSQIERLAEAGPEDVKRINDLIKGMLSDSHLPRDYRTKARERAKELACDAMTRATAKALEMATLFAKADKKPELRNWIKVARERMRMAIRFGASEDFEKATEAAMDAISHSGGVSHHGGATRAKPQDNAPAAPHV